MVQVSALIYLNCFDRLERRSSPGPVSWGQDLNSQSTSSCRVEKRGVRERSDYWQLPSCHVCHVENSTDVQVICKGKAFPCHKVVLSAKSPVLKTFLTGDSKENHENKIDIKASSPNAVELMLDCLYSGDFPLYLRRWCGTCSNSVICTSYLN